MTQRVELSRGGSTIRVVPSQVEFWEERGYAKAEKPAPKRAPRRSSKKKAGGDE